MVWTWKKERKIVTHPSAELTPQIILARSLDKAKEMKAVVVLILWEDSSFDYDSSAMKFSELCFLEKQFGIEVANILSEGRR